LSRWGIRRHRIAKAEAEAQAPAKGEAQAQAKVGAQAQAPIVRHEFFPPPKQCRIAQFQMDAGSSSSDDPQLHTPSFDFNPSLPLPDPQRTKVSGRFINDVLLNLHTWTHRTTNDSDNEDSEDASEGDAVKASDSIDPGTNDFSDGEDIDMEGNVDLHEGIIVDWDVFTEELGEFEPSSLHILGLTGVFVLRRVLYLRP